MQDVTIKAPKVAVSVPQVLSWIAVINAIKDSLVAQKVEIPGAISDALTMLGQVSTAVSSATPPNNLDGILADLLVVLKSVEVTTGRTVLPAGVQDVIAAISWTATGLTNVEAGQFATVATSKKVLSAGGSPIPVALLACRMDEGAAAIAAGFQALPEGQATVAAADYDALQTKCDALTADLAKANSQIASLNAALAAAREPTTAPPAGTVEPQAPSPQP